MANKPFCLGLTGSVGMGKSETAKMFAAFGLPVFDADAVVHTLYQNPEFITRIEHAFPGTTTATAVDRAALSACLKLDNAGFSRLAGLVHPQIGYALEDFLSTQALQGTAFVLLDIPLLYEAEWDRYCDAVVVVSAPAGEQRRRVLARPGMTAEKFALILSHQMPDAEKRSRADYIIDTGQGLAATQTQVRELVEYLHQQRENANHA